MRNIPLILAILASLLFAAVKPVEKDGYTMHWTSVEWEGMTDLISGEMEWEATLSGRLCGQGERRVVGYCVRLTEVHDASGRSTLPTEYEKRWSQRREDSPSAQLVRVLGGREQGLLGSFTVSLGGGTDRARRIEKAVGTCYVMEVDKTAIVDLPLDLKEGESRETDGARFTLVGVQRQNAQTLVILQHNLKGTAATLDLSKPPYLYAATSTDAEGNTIPTHAVNYSDQGETLTVVISQLAPDAPPPARLRLSVATAVIEREIPFEVGPLELNLGRPPAPPATEGEQDLR